MRYILALTLLVAFNNISHAQLGSWGPNGTDLHGGEGFTSPIIQYSDSMNLYYILAADSTTASSYRVDTSSVLGGPWGLLTTSIVADEFVIMDNGDLVFTRFQNGIMEIEATDPLGQSLWTASPAGQPFSGNGFYQLHIFNGHSDDIYVTIQNDGVGATYIYDNQTWGLIGDYTDKLEFLSNGDPVRATIDSDMTFGAEWITYTFENYNGVGWSLLDSAHFTLEQIMLFDFCVNKYDSIYMVHTVIGFVTGAPELFLVENFTATPIGPNLSTFISTPEEVHLNSDLLGDIHFFYNSYDLGWHSVQHWALDAFNHSTFGTGPLLDSQQGTMYLSFVNSPISTCIDENNCVGFAIAQHTDHFNNFGPDTIYVNTKKFCSCKYTDLQNTISSQGITLYANPIELATYQWLDCSNNYAIIPGATDTTYTPSVNGTYAVEVTMEGCVDTSECIGINTIGLPESAWNDNIKLFPNPTENYITVQLPDTKPMEIRIVNVNGSVVIVRNEETAEFTLDLSDLSPGIYTVQLLSDDFIRNFKVVRN